MNTGINIQPRNLAHYVNNLITNCKNISFLVEVAQKEAYDLYLVGGFLRDTLLGHVCKDVDFVSTKASELTKLVAKHTGSKPVLIDRKFGTTRFIPRVQPYIIEEQFVVDLSPLRGSTIVDDLYRRDFTINSLALDISAWRIDRGAHLLDPLGGIADLEAGRLRVCSKQSLSDDPLRILRAYRLVSAYGFRLAAQTRKSILQTCHHLHQVAVERIRDEMMLILSAVNSVSILSMLAEDGVLKLLLPECVDIRKNNAPHLDVWQHRFSTLEALEFLLVNLRELLGDYADEASIILTQKLGSERKRETALKLGVLLLHTGPPHPSSVGKDAATHFHAHQVAGSELAASLCTRLRLSNKEINFVSQLLRHHMRPMKLFCFTRTPSRELVSFFGLGPELFWPLLLLFASEYAASQGDVSAGGDLQPLRKRLHGWLDFYYDKLKPRVTAPPIVSGHDLIKWLHLPPGPLVGRLLKALSELQWEGRVSTRQEALDHAARLLEKWK
jgi:poly(A) polymerase